MSLHLVPTDEDRTAASGKNPKRVNGAKRRWAATPPEQRREHMRPAFENRWPNKAPELDLTVHCGLSIEQVEREALQPDWSKITLQAPKAPRRGWWDRMRARFGCL